jgi:hypothetical protein
LALRPIRDRINWSRLLILDYPQSGRIVETVGRNSTIQYRAVRDRIDVDPPPAQLKEEFNVPGDQNLSLV